MRFVIIFLILSPSIVSAQYFEPFSDQDIILQSVYTSFTVIDWMQTKSFVSDGHKETNPIFGDNPSQQRIDFLISLGIVSHALIAYAIPKKYRYIWQSLFIVVEFDAFCHNYKSGKTDIIINLKPVCGNYPIHISFNW